MALGWLASNGRLGVLPLLSGPQNSIRNAIVENRTVVLADGSQLTLGGQSLAEVSFNTRARQIVLERGEAFFMVAKDSTRPFTVRAAGTKVTALGTQFNVRRRSEGVTVAVVEGRVRVEQASLLPSATPPVQVGPGQQDCSSGRSSSGRPTTTISRE